MVASTTRRPSSVITVAPFPVPVPGWPWRRAWVVGASERRTARACSPAAVCCRTSEWTLPVDPHPSYPMPLGLTMAKYTPVICHAARITSRRAGHGDYTCVRAHRDLKRVHANILQDNPRLLSTDRALNAAAIYNLTHSHLHPIWIQHIPPPDLISSVSSHARVNAHVKSKSATAKRPQRLPYTCLLPGTTLLYHPPTISLIATS